MHERPLYYVFALFVALLMVNLVSPVFGDEEYHTEEYVTYSINANKTFFDVTSPVSINFTSSLFSTSPSLPDTYQWTIFERNKSTYNISPIISGTEHNYTCTISHPGLYGVTCNATNSTWVPVHNIKTNPYGFITAYLPVSANFTNTTPTTGVLPLKVSFYSDNFTGGPDKWEWQYGTNNTTGNPGHLTFSSEGTFQVNHTVWNTSYNVSDMSDSNQYKYKNDWVNSSTSNIFTIIGKEGITTNFSTNISDFTGQAKGEVPLVLNFFDNSTGDDINGWNWNFGDGRTSLDQHPKSIVYSNPGLYDVSLNVSSPWDYNLTTQEFYVNAYMPISANFTFSPEGSCPPPAKQPFPVNFSFFANETKVGESIPDVFNWNFGDGSANDTGKDPTHIFYLPGQYNVTLTTQNLTHDIETSEMKQVDVTGLYANFIADPMIGYQTTTNQPIKVNFTYDQANVTDAGATLFHWDFGNGDSTNEPDTTVSTIYDRPGTYIVSFTVGNNCEQYNTTSKKVTIIERPVANFTYHPSYGTFPLSVQFNDTSTDSPNQWEWDFGDGSLRSTVQNPEHLYNSPGSYLVTLKVKNTTVVPIWNPAPLSRYITLSSGIDANFTTNRSIGASPLTVQFTDKSSPSGLVSNWSWDFGDNSEKSNLTNPVHTFVGPGNYMVNLTVWNATTKAQGNHEKEIKVLDQLVANFRPNETARMNKSEGVQFTDLSTGDISIWYWDFGDGNHSYNKNPVNIFPEYDQYPVSLTIENQYGDTDFIEFLVDVTPAEWPYIDFEVKPPVANKMDIVNFVVTEIGGTDVSTPEWDFGDGSEKVIKNNPTHQFQKSGKFNVTAMVSNDYGTANKTHIASIRGLDANFTIVPPGGWAVVNTPVTFIDSSTGNPEKWFWDFDDGSTETTYNNFIVHSFTKEGVYNVNMTATNWEPVSDSISHKLTILNKSVPQGVDFEVPGLHYSGKAPFDVQFEDKTPSQSNVIDWFWEFGDGSNSFEQAPTHRYEKPGQYTVTLTVRNENGTNEKRRVAYVVVL